jgi:WD40 repeat protein
MNVYDFAESDLLHTAQFEADDQPLPTLADNGLAFGPDGALAYADARPSRSSLAFWMPDEGVTYAATGALSVSDATAVTYDSFGALVAYFADGPTLVRRFVDQTDFIVESIALPFDANNAFSRHAVFSPDGMLLAVDGCLSADVRGGSACSDYRIALIETLSGSVLATVSTGFAGPGQGMALGIQADDRRVLLAVSGCMRFSGGTLLDAVCTNETIALWDVTGLTSGATTEPETLTVVDGAGAVAFNADATLLASANDTQLQVIDVAAGEILLSHSLSGSDGGLAFNSEDTLVAVGSEGTVLLLGLPLD